MDIQHHAHYTNIIYVNSLSMYSSVVLELLLVLLSTSAVLFLLPLPLLRTYRSRSSFGSFGSSPIGVTTSGRSVGGGANSIFGFCSCSKQWSKHWSTTISISSSSGHSRLGQGDHQTCKNQNVHFWRYCFFLFSFFYYERFLLACMLRWYVTYILK